MKVTQEVFKTTRDQLVVLIPVLKNETESGIIIPESVLQERLKEKGLNEFVEVVAVGGEVKEIKVGDRVLVQRKQEVPVEATDKDYTVAVVREYDVVGFYKPVPFTIGVDANTPNEADRLLEDSEPTVNAIGVGTKEYKEVLSKLK